MPFCWLAGLIRNFVNHLVRKLSIDTQQAEMTVILIKIEEEKRIQFSNINLFGG